MATQGQWSGDWSGDWFGADGAAPTQAAPRGLLAFWAGGAVAGIAPETSAGVRSLLAPWVGGASVTPTADQVGVRSLLAPWVDDGITVTIGGTERVERLGRRTSYTYQLEVFTQWVREGGSIPTDADDAVANMRMIDAVYEMSGLGLRRTFGSDS